MNEAFEQVVGSLSGDGAARRRRAAVPFSCWGRAWRGCSSSSWSRRSTSCTSRCRTGNFEVGYTVRLERGRRTTTRSRSTTSSSCARCGYAATATLLALRHLVPARVLHRVQGGPVEEPHAAADHPAVLHELPDADGGVADDPRRQRRSSPSAARRRAARRGRPPAGDDDRGHRGHHLQLPAVHGAAAVRVAREDRPAADRGGDRPVRQPRARRSCASRCRSRCRASSPARC